MGQAACCPPLGSNVTLCSGEYKKDVFIKGDIAMKEARSTDKTAYTKFRPGRFFKDGGKWFFHTREGTFEGPFEMRAEAESRMEEYIRIAQSGFMNLRRDLSLEPLEMRWR